MNHDPAAERRERLRLEAYALRHVFQQAPEERLAKAEELEACAWALPSLLGTVCQELEHAPNMELTDLAALVLRPSFNAEVKALDEAQLGDFLSRGIDSGHARKAFEACLADTDRKGDEGRIKAARLLLDAADTAATPQTRKEKLADAARVLERPDRTDEGTPSSLWAAYLASRSGEPATKHEAVQLDRSKRGQWADWFNAHLGQRGGLEPGRTLIIGGAPGAGKTSLGAALAVDALEAGCPVLFWQLELSRDDALEHLAAQRPAPGAWWGKDFRTRAWNTAAVPESWDNLLRVPRAPVYEAEELERAFLRMARESRSRRNAGTLKHACNGLALVDYVQLLTLHDRRARDAGHEVLTTAVSRLAKAAAESGVCLVLLSQLNKADRQQGQLADTALAGADLARMAHCAVFIQKAHKENGTWKACAADKQEPFTDPGKGEARLLSWTKTRGVQRTGPLDRVPDKPESFWCYNRALHDGAPTTRKSNT